MTDTVILDVDGTLVDTNYHHAVCWYRAFRRYDITVPVSTIHRAIGMGGDQIVAAVGGERAEEEHGDDLRAAWSEEFDPMLGEISALPGARGLLRAVRDQGLGLVMASSGKPEHAEHYAELIGAEGLADAWVSSGDVSSTKPAPDLMQVAMQRVGADRAVAIGDSLWDCQAAARLGIPSIAVYTGGFARADLTEAGATSIYDSVDALVADIASLRPSEPAPQS